jgi:hypothetical protein
MRFLAIVPLGFGGFFALAAIDCWGDVFQPRFAEMRLVSFGVAWLMTFLAIGCLVGTVAIVCIAGERGEKGT